MIKPKVTIIMATYNRAHFIVETLHSIQKQTFGDWECLVIDDGGTDNTQEVITPILEQDNRFHFFKRPDVYLKGLPGCRNYGLDLAQGDFIIFFDDDDIVHPDLLKICLQIVADKNVDFCHYQKQPFTNALPTFEFSEVKVERVLNSTLINEVITQKIGLASCTVLWDKKCFKDIRFEEKLLYAEEWECYSKIITSGFKGIIIGNILYFNRKHPNSNTGEFYNNDPVRRASKNEAILLVVKNLKKKNLLSESLLIYFIKMSIDFKRYSLFSSLLRIAQLSFYDQLKYIVYYHYYNVRIYLYRIKKKLIK